MKKIVFACFVFQVITIAARPQSAGDTLITIVNGFDWMPDGKAVCFSALRRDKTGKLIPKTGLFLLDISTKKITHLINKAMEPCVSNDGKRIAYTVDSSKAVRNF